MRDLGGVKRTQHGFSMMGLIFWAFIVAMAGLLAVKVSPVLLEYQAIKRAVQQIKDAGPGSVQDVQRAFEKQVQIEYSIQSITAQDLEVSINGTDVSVAFAYDREVPLFGPVILLFRLSGASR